MSERGRPKHPEILTPRQREVLELVREGLTNPQIGERLGISTDGAKWHVKEILWKLDVPSREEAAEWPGEEVKAPIAIRPLQEGLMRHLGRGKPPMENRGDKPTLRIAA